MLIKSFRIQESSDGLTLVLIEASKFEPIDVNQVAMKRERPEFSDFLTLLITSTFKFLRSLNFDGDLFGGTYYCGVFLSSLPSKDFYWPPEKYAQNALAFSISNTKPYQCNLLIIEAPVPDPTSRQPQSI